MELSGSKSNPAVSVAAPWAGRPVRRRSASDYHLNRSHSGPVVTSRRPYSAYTKRDGEAENTPKYDDERTNREWWRFYVKVVCFFVLFF